MGQTTFCRRCFQQFNCLGAAWDVCRSQRYRLWWSLLLPGLIVLAGCTGRVIPPAVLSEPVDVYLVDHGRHSSLVLERPDGVVRYAYGEWDWYARDRRGSLAAMSAMLWPSRGALGRKVYPGVEVPPFPERIVPEGFEEVFVLRAEAARVRQLRSHLDAIFEEGRGDLIYHSFYDLEFVPYPRAYWLAHQSNVVTAEWLRQLGFTVRGTAWSSNWRIELPAETAIQRGHSAR